MNIAGSIKSHRYLLPILLLLIIAVVRIMQLSDKEEMHPDEVYSIMLARCNPLFYTALEEKTYSGEELKDKLVTDNPLSEDIARLHSDNADAPHASLYYMTLRLFIANTDQWSPHDLILAGGVLNIILLIISYLLLWCICSRLNGGNVIISLPVLALAFASPAAGECCMLMREYQMAVCATLWMLLSLLKYIKSEAVPTRLILQIILSTACVISTGYLNGYLIAGLYFLAFIYTIARSHGRKPLWLPLCGIMAILVAWAVYFGFFNFMLHSNPHTEMAFTNFISTMSQVFSRDLYKEFLTPIGSFLLLATVLLPALIPGLRKKSFAFSSVRLPLVIVGIGLVAIILIQYTSVLKEARYSYPALPLLTLSIPVILSLWKKKIQLFIAAVITVYYLGAMIAIPPTMDYGWKQMSVSLDKDIVLYDLNPNEVPLIIPMLSSKREYTIMSRTDSIHYTKLPVCVVHYTQSSLAKDSKPIKLVGPLLLLEK